MHRCGQPPSIEIPLWSDHASPETPAPWVAILVIIGSVFLSAAASAHPMAPPAPGSCRGPDAPITTVVDSIRHAVVITLGPCTVPALGTMNMGRMSDMEMMVHSPGHEDVRARFRWPANVWMRSFDLKLYDRNHHRLDQPTTMHHMELLNFDRRQIIYPMVERVFGMGEETSGAKIPKSVGLPLDAGMDMGLYVMWNAITRKYPSVVVLKQPKVHAVPLLSANNQRRQGMRSSVLLCCSFFLSWRTCVSKRK